jgi:hypothetical protein
MKKNILLSIIMCVLGINVSLAQQKDQLSEDIVEDEKPKISQLPKVIKLDVISGINRIVSITYEQYLGERYSLQVTAGPTFYAPYRTLFDNVDLPPVRGAFKNLQPLFLNIDNEYSRTGGHVGLSARGYLGGNDRSTYFLELGSKFATYSYYNSSYQFDYRVWDQVQFGVGARWIFSNLLLEVGAGISRRLINTDFQSLKVANDFGSQQDHDQGGVFSVNVGYMF